MLKSLLNQPGVDGFLIYNQSGVPLKWSPHGFSRVAAASTVSTPIPAGVVQHAALLHRLTDRARAAAARLLGDDAGGDGELTLMRLRTTTAELIVSPAAEATLVVLQRAHSAALVPTT